jgi:hypothetical protein
LINLLLSNLETKYDKSVELQYFYLSYIDIVAGKKQVHFVKKNCYNGKINRIFYYKKLQMNLYILALHNQANNSCGVGIPPTLEIQRTPRVALCLPHGSLVHGYDLSTKLHKFVTFLNAESHQT